MISDVETLVERRLCVGCGICGVVSDKTKFTNSPDQGLLLPDFKNSTKLKLRAKVGYALLLHRIHHISALKSSRLMQAMTP